MALGNSAAQTRSRKCQCGRNRLRRRGFALILITRCRHNPRSDEAMVGSIILGIVIQCIRQIEFTSANMGRQPEPEDLVRRLASCNAMKASDRLCAPGWQKGYNAEAEESRINRRPSAFVSVQNVFLQNVPYPGLPLFSGRPFAAQFQLPRMIDHALLFTLQQKPRVGLIVIKPDV